MSNDPRASWLMKLRRPGPLVTAWIQSAVIVCISNSLAQIIDSHKKEVYGPRTAIRCSISLTKLQQEFEFDYVRLFQFLCLDLITAPLNYKWQELLEKSFPRHGFPPPGRAYEPIPLEDRDVEKNSYSGDDEDTAEGPSRQKVKRAKERLKKAPKLNWKNIWTKWFIDCITFGAVMNTVAFLVIMGLLKGQPEKIGHNLRTQTIPIILNGYKLWPVANIIAHSVIPFERRIVFFATVALCWNVYLSLLAARL